MTPLQEKVKNNYTEDEFRVISQYILELKKKITQRPPQKMICEKTIDIINAICEKKIEDYIEFYKEVTST